MVVIPGDRVRIGARTMTVAEAHPHSERLVRPIGTDGWTVWVAPSLVHRADPDER